MEGNALRVRREEVLQDVLQLLRALLRAHLLRALDRRALLHGQVALVETHAVRLLALLQRVLNHRMALNANLIDVWLRRAVAFYFREERARPELPLSAVCSTQLLLVSVLTTCVL